MVNYIKNIKKKMRISEIVAKLLDLQAEFGDANVIITQEGDDKSHYWNDIKYFWPVAVKSEEQMVSWSEFPIVKKVPMIFIKEIGNLYEPEEFDDTKDIEEIFTKASKVNSKSIEEKTEPIIHVPRTEKFCDLDLG